MGNRFVDWAGKSYPSWQRLMVMIPLGFMFLLLIPGMIFFTSRIDVLLSIAKMSLGTAGLLIAGVFMVTGFFFGVWTVIIQFDEATGTPIPMMPTQKLITTGPYRYCRNPMVLGTMMAYFGVVVLAGSLSSFIFYALLMSALLIYVKKVEERELAERFGREYLMYKEKVPFIIPRRRML